MDEGRAIVRPCSFCPSRFGLWVLAATAGEPAYDGEYHDQDAKAQGNPADALDDPFGDGGDEYRADGGEPHASDEAAAWASASKQDAPSVGQRYVSSWLSE